MLVPKAYKEKNDLNKTDWIIGKVCLLYSNGLLKAEFKEYKYPIRFQEIYKSIQIIQINLPEKGRYYTILKNKNNNNPKIVFKGIRGVKDYISSFDTYSDEDRHWFLIKEE